MWGRELAWGKPQEHSAGLPGKGPCKQARQPERPGRGREESLILRGVWVLRTLSLGRSLCLLETRFPGLLGPSLAVVKCWQAPQRLVKWTVLPCREGIGISSAARPRLPLRTEFRVPVTARLGGPASGRDCRMLYPEGWGTGLGFGSLHQSVTHAPGDREGAAGPSPPRAGLFLPNAHVAVTQQTWELLSCCGRTCGQDPMIEGGLVAFPVGGL